MIINVFYLFKCIQYLKIISDHSIFLLYSLNLKALKFKFQMSVDITAFLRDGIKNDEVNLIEEFTVSEEEYNYLFEPTTASLPSPIEFNCPILSASIYFNAPKCFNHLIGGSDINKPDQWGVSPVHFCCKFDKISFLTNEKFSTANFSATDWKGQTPLHYSAASGSVSTFQFLLEQGVDINVSDKFGLTPLHVACQNGNAQIVDLLLQRGAEITPDFQQRLPLFYAISGNHFEIIPVFKQYRPELLTAVDPGQRSLLHIASIYGASKCITPLIEAGCDPNALDAISMAPIHYAAENNQIEVITVLLSISSLDRSILDYFGNSSVHISAEFNCCKSISTIIDSDDQLCDIKNKNGQTALHIAALNGNVEAVKALLKNGCTSNIIDINGKIPKDLASGSYADLIVNLLDGKNVNMSNLRGNPQDVGIRERIQPVKQDENDIKTKSKCNIS